MEYRAVLAALHWWLDRPALSSEEAERGAIRLALGFMNDAVWDQIHLSQDIFSYRFNRREFPLFNAIPLAREVRNVADASADALVEPIKHKLPRIRYDLVAIAAGGLNGNFTDESESKSGESKSGGEAKNGGEAKSEWAWRRKEVPPALTAQPLLVPYMALSRSHYYSVFSVDQIRGLLRRLCARQMDRAIVTLFGALATSRELCHLAFDATLIHELNAALAVVGPQGGYDLYEHCLFYALHLLYREECFMKTHLNCTDRCIWNLRTACELLPPRNSELPDNPYFPVSLSDSILRQEHVSAPALKRLSHHHRGLYNLAAFRRRFAIFTEGIFEGMEMTKLCFTGSVMAACLFHNPLELCFDDTFAYFETHYPSRRSGVPEESLSDIDIIVEVLDNAVFDEHATYIFNHISRALQAHHPGATLDLRLLQITSSRSYKYLIRGSSLPRNIEIFRMFIPNSIGGIARFHFPSVRCYYNGYEVFLTTSALAYAHSGAFTDYKWMASIHDAKSLIAKYYRRGGFTLLNAIENEAMTKHLAEINSPLSLYPCTGARLTVNHPFFAGRKYVGDELKAAASQKRYAWRDADGHLLPVRASQLLSFWGL